MQHRKVQHEREHRRREHGRQRRDDDVLAEHDVDQQPGVRTKRE